MLYNNFVERRRECSFLGRVLARNDVNEKKKYSEYDGAERASQFSLVVARSFIRRLSVLHKRRARDEKHELLLS